MSDQEAAAPTPEVKVDGVVSLTRELLEDEKQRMWALAVIGGLAIRSLLEYGQFGCFLNPANNLELAPVTELVLDSLPEEAAIQTLLDRGQPDDQVLRYLRGREARLARFMPAAQPAEVPQEVEPQTPLEP